MTLRVVHAPTKGEPPTGPWELIAGFLFPPGSYRSIWAGETPEHVSVIRLKCLLDNTPRFPWAEHSSGSWDSGCDHRPLVRSKGGLVLVPLSSVPAPPCKPCMIDAGADGLMVELAASQPSSMGLRMVEVQDSEIEARNVVAGGQGVYRIQPSAPKPHPRSPGWVTEQWEDPRIEGQPPTEAMKRNP